MNYFEENTPFSSFLHDYDDTDILVENDNIDDDLFPEETLEEDFPDFIDNDWSWLM